MSQDTAETFECKHGHRFTVIVHQDARAWVDSKPLDPDGPLHMDPEPPCIVVRCYALCKRVGITVLEDQ